MIIGDTAVGRQAGIGASYTVATKTYSLSMLLNAQTGGGYGGWGMGFSSIYSPTAAYTFDLLSLAHPTASLPVSARFLHPIVDLAMDFRAILSPLGRIPTDSIVNTLFWSWATVLDQSYRRILQATQATSLPSAETTDLDNIGQIYHLPRLLNETDDHYRLRLVTQTSVLIGCGTKANAEAVINQIVSGTGTEITTGPPATVRISFTDHDSAMAAITLQTTITNVLPNLFAAGIAYTLYIPIAPYLADIVIIGTANLPYNVSLRSAKRYDTSILATTTLCGMHDNTYSMDELVKFTWTKSYYMGLARPKASHIKGATFDIFNILRLTKTYLMNELVRNTHEVSWAATEQCRKVMDKVWPQDALFQGSATRRCSMEMTVI